MNILPCDGSVERRAERFSIIDEMRDAFRDVPADEIEREASRTLTEVRAEQRVEQDEAGSHA